jgi:hypothetical protein
MAIATTGDVDRTKWEAADPLGKGYQFRHGLAMGLDRAHRNAQAAGGLLVVLAANDKFERALTRGVSNEVMAFKVRPRLHPTRSPSRPAIVAQPGKSALVPGPGHFHLSI